MKYLILCVMTVLFWLSSCQKPAPLKMPEIPGWSLNGVHKDCYSLSVDGQNPYKGKFSARLQSTNTKKDMFAALSQSVHIGDMAGKRVRMQACIRTADVKKSAALWFRADKGERMLCMDNMAIEGRERFIKGNTEWQLYDLVLDVPDSADILHFGAYLEGEGSLWVDAFQFEVVDASVAATGETYNYANVSDTLYRDYHFRTCEDQTFGLENIQPKFKPKPAVFINIDFEEFADAKH
jgi:hypothetical protein